MILSRKPQFLKGFTTKVHDPSRGFLLWLGVSSLFGLLFGLAAHWWRPTLAAGWGWDCSRGPSTGS